MKRLYFGGTIITMKSASDFAEAVLAEDGKIIAVGKLDEIENISGDAERINLVGRVLLPAFTDSHSHFSMLAMNLAKADLSQAECFDDIVRILKEFREKNKLFNGEYIQGFGYDHNSLAEGRHPDKRVLDKVSRENPIFIFHASFHMGVGNSLALERAGITSESPLPPVLAGRLSNGEPSGYLAETGMTAVFMQLEKLPLDLPALYKKAQEVYLSNGICTVQDGALGRDQFFQLKKYAESGELKPDILSYLVMSDFAHTTAIENKSMLSRYENHLKIGGYKLILDGSPQGKTAWLSEPYTDGTNGNQWMTDEQVYFFVKQAIDDGIQLLTHCNGDAASEQLIGCYEKALSQSDNPNKHSLNPVMIHSQTVRKDQLERFAAIKMMPSFFVDHVYYWGDVHLKNLGEKRAENISPVGWAKELGLPYTFHQDTPVIPPDMLKTVQTAVQRVTKNGVLLGANQRASVYDALKAITINSAFQYGEENQKGTVEVGKYADFVILDRNPLITPIEELSKIKVTETIFRGEPLYMNF